MIRSRLMRDYSEYVSGRNILAVSEEYPGKYAIDGRSDFNRLVSRFNLNERFASGDGISNPLKPTAY